VGCEDGQRLQLRFGKSGAAQELGLVQIVVEASGRVSQPLDRISLVLACTVTSFCGDYGEVLSIRTAGYKVNILETMA